MPRSAASPSPDFAGTLNRLIEQRGVTQAQVAEAIGVHSGDVGRWRKGGGISIQNVRKLATYFGLERATLERLAGYGDSNAPVDATNELDPEAEYFRSKWDHIQKRVPRPFWRVYAEAMESLAEAYAGTTNAPPEGTANDGAHKNGTKRGRPRKQQITISKRPIRARLQFVSISGAMPARFPSARPLAKAA